MLITQADDCNKVEPLKTEFKMMSSMTIAIANDKQRERLIRVVPAVRTHYDH